MAQPNSSDLSQDRFAVILKIVSFVSGIALIILGIVKFTTFSIGGVRDFFLTIYYILFGILVCLVEMPCERLLSCFFFLKYYIGKSLFFLFLGTITFTWSPFYYLIISIIFLVDAGFYFLLFITCKARDFNSDNEKPAPGFEKRELDNNA